MSHVQALWSLVLVCASMTSSCGCSGRLPPPPVPAPPVRDTVLFTPEWAFEPWISKDISNGPDTDAFVEGFQQRDIPVGVVVLDSPWSTNYNNYIVNDARYPDFPGMVQRLRDDNIRLVLWTTAMVNESSYDLESGGDNYEGASENFYEGLEAGYYINEGATSFWWKGFGAGIDFFDDEAVAWWRNHQTPLLNLGVNGFKLDFYEQYVDLPIQSDAGEKTLQEYSEAYYLDYLAHGQATHSGGVEEFVNMVRPYDESYGFDPRFYARPEHAPVAWVGDQDQNWPGLNDALDHILRSADAGYAVVGSDIGGYLNTYLGQDIPFELEVFQRWTAMSGMMPFFQLHGRENLSPWTVPGTDDEVEQTVAAYRYWATLHHHMVPYWFSITHTAHSQPTATGILHPVGNGIDEWVNHWRYFVGDAFLVAPLFEPGGSRDVLLPTRDNDVGYVDWWNLGGERLLAGSTVAFATTDAVRIPVYVVEGAIIPMHVDNDATGFGTADSVNHTTLLAFPAPTGTSTFISHERVDGNANGQRTPTEYVLTRNNDDIELRATAVRTPLIVRVRTRDAWQGASTVDVDGVGATVLATRSAFFSTQNDDATTWYDEEGAAMWVRVPSRSVTTIRLTTP
jgi:alpha-glucosidase (family GH31 glycosyl hydrolase)